MGGRDGASSNTINIHDRHEIRLSLEANATGANAQPLTPGVYFYRRIARCTGWDCSGFHPPPPPPTCIWPLHQRERCWNTLRTVSGDVPNTRYSFRYLRKKQAGLTDQAGSRVGAWVRNYARIAHSLCLIMPNIRTL